MSDVIHVLLESFHITPAPDSVNINGPILLQNVKDRDKNGRVTFSFQYHVGPWNDSIFLTLLVPL